MNRITTMFITLGLAVLVIIPSCKKDSLADQQSILANQHDEVMTGQQVRKKLLLSGPIGPLGCTIGPGGDLFVPDPVAGAILRINPMTGDYTTFATGLPTMILEFGFASGVNDVAFIDDKAYALVSCVDDPLFPTGQVNGIYRIDGPNTYTIIADIGAFNVANPPTGFYIEVVTGVSYAIQTYGAGFLVTDGHLNRMLYVSLDGKIKIVKQFDNVVPTGLDVKGGHVFLSQAGPLPHLPENGKIVTSNSPSSEVKTIASGAPMMVDVEFGRDRLLFGLSQGDYSGDPEGYPALPNTGSLLRVKPDGTFSIIAEEINQPTSFEIIGNTAYIVTLSGEIWAIDNICSPSDQ